MFQTPTLQLDNLITRISLERGDTGFIWTQNEIHLHPGMSKTFKFSQKVAATSSGALLLVFQKISQKVWKKTWQRAPECLELLIVKCKSFVSSLNGFKLSLDKNTDKISSKF